MKPSPSYVRVWFGLSFIVDLFCLLLEKKNGKYVESERDGGPNQLTAEPPHRCCSLHPWSEMVSNKRRRRRGVVGEIPR